MSHTAMIKTIQQYTREKVMGLLEWDDLRYGEFQMQQADAYLEHHIGADVWGLKEIRESEHFWKWWRNHWFTRDADFIADAKGMSVDDRRLYYEVCHEVEAIEFSPASALMHHTFSRQVVNAACGLPETKRRMKI